MKRLLLGCVLSLAGFDAAIAQGSHYVRGYVRRDGTYVAPHYQTNPDGNVWNNWSTEGNVNPYTGKPGTRSPYASPNYGYSYTPAPTVRTYPQPSYGGYGAPSDPEPTYSSPATSAPNEGDSDDSSETPDF